MQNKVHGFKLNGDISGYLEKYHGGSRTKEAAGGYRNPALRDEWKNSGMEQKTPHVCGAQHY
jgi:hypothetical protein